MPDVYAGNNKPNNCNQKRDFADNDKLNFRYSVENDNIDEYFIFFRISVVEC